ncbi:MAG: outer membrane beta-barrel protein, partial [Chitinivibrionales bacterium]|nr:outer membrane beta-barrel protein [Chitinivibrionales bacterium]
MKKQIILAIIVLLACTVISPASDRFWSTKFAFSSSTWTGPDIHNSSFMPGYAMGFDIQIPVFSRLSFRPGLQLLTKGSTVDNHAIQDYYVAAPLAAKLSYNAAKTFSPYLFGGTEYGIAIRARKTGGNNYRLINIGSSRVFVEHPTTTADFGFSVGGGLDIVMEETVLIFEAKYYQGALRIS